MRRHEIRHAIGAGLMLACLLAATSACGGSDDYSPAPVTSASSSAPAATTTSASPVAGTAAADAAITLTAPGNGATVGRSFVVRGSGMAFEGTLLWTLDGPGEPISGYSSAGSTEKQPFQFTVEAPAAGSYKLMVYRESADDGSRTDVVERAITVR